MVCLRVVAIRAEVFSRVVGYYRPVDAWHEGKRAEWDEREYYSLPAEEGIPVAKESAQSQNDPVGGDSLIAIPTPYRAEASPAV